MLTSRAKYAVRASMALAERRDGPAWSSAGVLAEAAGVPRKFLEAILTQLRDQGLVESKRGPLGGHRLVAEPGRVSVADVIRSIDGPLAMTPCASLTQFRACDDCVSVETCRISNLMRQARDAVATVLEQCSLADLIAFRPDGSPPTDTGKASIAPGGAPSLQAKGATSSSQAKGATSSSQATGATSSSQAKGATSSSQATGATSSLASMVASVLEDGQEFGRTVSPAAAQVFGILQEDHA